MLPRTGAADAKALWRLAKDKILRKEKMKRLAFSFLLSATMPALATGATQPDQSGSVATLSQRHADCAARAGSILPDMLACNDVEYAWQSKRMDSAYRLLLKRLSKRDKDRLRAIQRNWMLARDGTCGFYYKLDKSDSVGIDQSVCLLHTTARRAALFESWGSQID